MVRFIEILVVLFIAMFVLVMGYESCEENKCRYRIELQHDRNSTTYYTNNYSIDNKGCIHFCTRMEGCMTICGSYRIY